MSDSPSLWNNDSNGNRAHDFLFRSSGGRERYAKGRVTDDLIQEKRALINRHKDNEIDADELQRQLKAITLKIEGNS